MIDFHGITGGRRSYSSRYFALALDQAKQYKVCGYLKNAEGGAIKSEVVEQVVGGRATKAKHIGLPTYEPFSIQCGMSMSADFWKWMEASWAGKASRMNGALLALDANHKVQHEHSFQNALITETTIPACDGSSKEPAYMTVKFHPEKSAHKTVKNGPTQRPEYSKDQKEWLAHNFRLELDGLPCRYINKVDSFTVKQSVKRLEVGGQRDYELEPTKLEHPNLTLYMGLAHAEQWFKWHDDFVVRGNNNSDKEKTGRLVFLSPNRNKELWSVDLRNVGIFSATVDKGDSATETIKRAKFELYVEEMGLKYAQGGGSAGVHFEAAASAFGLSGSLDISVGIGK